MFHHNHSHSDSLSCGQPVNTISPEIAADLKLMISQLKEAGQLPRDADEAVIMNSMISDMLNQKPNYLMAAHTPKGSRSAVSTNADNGTASLPWNSLFDIMKGFAAFGHSHEGLPCQSELKENPYIVQDIESATLTYLQQNPASINEQDENGITVLHYVSTIGQEKLARILLACGSNPNAVDDLGQSPVHKAARYGHIMIIQLLIEHGANIFHKDNNGWSALHHGAAGPDLYCPHVLHYLTFCCGLSYSDTTNDGMTLLHIVARNPKENNRDMLAILLSKHELDVFLMDVNGHNALHYAVQHAQTNMCYRIVCQTGTKILRIGNKDGKTPLEMARNHHSLDVYYLSLEMEKWMSKGELYRPNSNKPSEYWKELYLPSAAFLMFVAASMLFTPTNQGYLASLGFAAYQFFIFSPSHRINHCSQLPSPSKLGGFMSALIICGYILYAAVIPVVYSTRFLSCVFLVLCGPLLMYLTYRLVTVDPGFTYESKRKESGEFYTMADLVHTFKKPGIWCSSCQLIPTKPTKHCKLCDRCVYWMDHHCVYINRCVGYLTMFTFVWFSIVLVLVQLVTISLVPDYLYATFKNNSLIGNLIELFNLQGYAFVMLAGLVAFCWFTIKTLIDNLVNISNGYTEFFKPKDVRSVSGLSCGEKMTNLVTYLRTGRQKSRDPYFNI